MNKKDIAIHKKKTDYNDGYEYQEAKEILFNQLTIQEIITELSCNHITITLEEIKSKYEKSHHLQTVLNEFDDKYDNELEALDNKMELFDTDALYFICNKYILENYYPNQLFDPDYMEDLIDEYEEAKEKQKPQLLLNILRNINGIAKYHKSKDLDVIFEGTLFDIESYVVDCPMIVLNFSIPKKEVILFVNEFKQFINTYDIDKYNQFNIYHDLIELLARYGLKEVQELFDLTLKLFPNEKQAIYLSLLNGLVVCNEIDNMKLYYQKAIKLMPISEFDQEERKILIKEYSYLKD